MKRGPGGFSAVREEISRSASEKSSTSRPKESSLLARIQPRSDAGGHRRNARSADRARFRNWIAWVQILCRRTKNNPVLIGEPGVGKTAIVEGLAQKIADGDVPSFLSDKRISGARFVADRRRDQVSRAIRRTFENHHEGIDGEPERHYLHRPNCTRWWAPGRPKGRLDAANILKTGAYRAARFSASGRRHPPNTASRSKKTGRSNGVSRRSKCPRRPRTDAIRILFGIKERYEKISRGRVYGTRRIESAVLPHRLVF